MTERRSGLAGERERDFGKLKKRSVGRGPLISRRESEENGEERAKMWVTELRLKKREGEGRDIWGQRDRKRERNAERTRRTGSRAEHC